MTLALDIFLGVLLVIAIGYGYLLNRRIVELRKDQRRLEKLAASFSDATARAENGVIKLKNASDAAVRDLKESIAVAETIGKDLEFLVERGGETADRLEKGIRAGDKSAGPDDIRETLSRALATTTSADGRELSLAERLRLAQAPPNQPRQEAEESAPSQPRATAEEERDILRALQAVR